jgi:hypothetical protein
MHIYLQTALSSPLWTVIAFQSAQAGNPGRLQNAGSFFGLPGLSQASAFVFYSVIVLGRMRRGM